MGDLYPGAKVVPVRGGKHALRITPWTMAQRRELRPTLEQMIREAPDSAVGTELLRWFMAEGQDHLETIVKGSITDWTCHGDGCAAHELTWDELLVEDLFILSQAVWETTFLREDGGGIVGKAVGAVAGLMQLAKGRVAPSTGTAPKPPGSPSSPDAGAAPPNGSGTS